MKNKETKNAVLASAKNILGNDFWQGSSNLPINVGEKLQFVDSEKLIEGVQIRENVVPMFNLTDGRRISVSAVLVPNNGLGLSGTREDMLSQLLDKIDDNFVITVKSRYAVPTGYGSKICYTFSV